MSIQKNKISEIQASRFKYLLKGLPIKVDLKAADLANDVILEVAKEFRVTCYDAAYLELAIREKLPLATLDKELFGAAKSAGIALLF